MKSVKNDKETKEPTYPKLMKATNTEEVVLFTEESNGIVVCMGVTGQGLGYASRAWNMSVFEDYTGEVILSN